jgi:hypothetical protein
VALKSRLGRGYTLRVSFTDRKADSHPEILKRIQDIAPDVLSSVSINGCEYSLHSKDSKVVKQVLEVLQAEKTRFGIASYDVHGTTIEKIFLDLMAADGAEEVTDQPEKPDSDSQMAAGQLDSHKLELTSGRKKSPLAQSLIIFYKRCLITRRSWLSSLLAVIVAVAGACIPLFFMNHRAETCIKKFKPVPNIPLYLGDSPYSSVLSTLFPGGRILVSPPELITTLGISAAAVPVVPIANNSTFINTVQQNYRNLSLGGVSMDTSNWNTLLAWEGTPPGLTGPTLLNLASNVLYNAALNASGRAANQPSIIAANFQSFPAVDAGTLSALKWVTFFWRDDGEP